MYSDTHFTRFEARQKMNQRVRSLVDFSGIPKGTTGAVTGFYAKSRSSLDEYGVEITWGVPSRIIDGFSRDEYIQFLEEID